METPRGYGEPQTSRPGGPLAGRLGLRILAGFLAVALLPLVVSTMLGYWRSYRILEEVAESSVEAVGEVGVLLSRTRMDRHFLALHAIAAGNEFLAGGLRRAAGDTIEGMALAATREAMEVYLRRQRDEEDSPFSTIFLLDPAGDLVASSSLLELDRDVFPPLSDAHRVLTVPGPEPGGPPSFLLLEPLTGIQGDVVGILGGLVRSARAHEFFQIAPQIGGSIETYILDQDGHPLFVSRDPASVDYAQPLATPLLDLPDGSRMRYMDRSGIEVIGVRADLPGYPWIQVTEIPVEEALGSLRRLRRAAVLLTLAFTLLVGVAAWILSAQIVAPVRVLVGAVRRLGQGDLGARVDLTQNDEIGELAAAFNAMAQQLEETSARAEELHHREIERAQQLATVGELASGLAHEIKNPMVAIGNGLDLVRRRVGKDEALDPILDEVVRETDRVLATIRDLLAFARPSSPEPRMCDPNDIVERALHLTRASASVSGINLEVELDPDLPGIVADPDQMRQALVNLILNAIQATPPKGSIQVRSVHSGAKGRGSTGSQHPADQPGMVRFEVSDTGPGIPDSDQHRVFKPFYTTKHTGTGLGLSITRGIVERHGGTLELRSREEGGTLALIALPVLPLAEGSIGPTAIHDSETYR